MGIPLTVKDDSFLTGNPRGGNYSLRDLLAEIVQPGDSAWAWDNYKRTILNFAARMGYRNFCEIGGGRYPLLNELEIQNLGVSYAINDIAQSELDRTPASYEKLCFDISDGGLALTPRYDLIFSKMVFEHIRDTEMAYRNIHKLLAPGGICINFHPTLFSPPFVINYCLPETASRKILRLFSRTRNDNQIPKFPAYYNRCFATLNAQERIRKIGFSEAAVVPFYGHTYFRKIPLLRQIDDYISRAARKRDFRLLSSYAYTIAKK